MTTALEYADSILHEFRPGKKAKSMERDGLLECKIICTDGTTARVTGYWAVEIMKRHDSELEQQRRNNL